MFCMESSPKTFDGVSMDRSSSFAHALQELKNLRPQLHSAAEYCEKSYLHSEQRQMVLDNLKDYAIRALVNAVDHLGTVAYKLNDLIEKQTTDVSSLELKISCIDQRICTCSTYMDKEGLRQQKLLAFIPRHHKHYILPDPVNKKVHFSPHLQKDPSQSFFQARARVRPSGTPGPNSLSSHLASETNSTFKVAETKQALTSNGDSKDRRSVFYLLDDKESIQTKSSVQLQLPNGGLVSDAVSQTIGIMHKDPIDGSKHSTRFRAFDNPNRHQIGAYSRSVLSAFFVRQKTQKLKVGYVS